MTERERLIELLKEHCVLRQDVLDCTNRKTDDCPECLAKHLLANGVLVPPCKVGDAVWYGWKDGAHPHTVKRIVTDEYGTYADTGSVFFPLDYFGKCVFFTKEEALKERKGK